jgi:putative NIF3 family GTP cyclohydrolase 1 type 2
MQAQELYRQLDRDFEIEQINDDWSFLARNEYIAPSFCAPHFAGLVLDNTREIYKVYTAVFPNNAILERIFSSGESDALLFCHHAMGYDGEREGFPFYDIPMDLLKRLRERRIAFYMLHAALDRNGPYSTSVSLANALSLPVVHPFCDYDGIQAGVICKTEYETGSELSEHVRDVVGHEVKRYAYGEDAIPDGLVAVTAGGGSYPFVARELAALGIEHYITGVTRPMPSFEPTMEFHAIARENGISLIGATHDSTEQYACRAMVRYFQERGIPAEFLAGEPCLNDL